MILVTVGCSNYGFDRLFKAVDELCEEGVLDGARIVAQTGKLDYKIKRFGSFEYASNEQMRDYMLRADLIISHAGTGSVIRALEQNKKVIIFPRLLEFNEHVSNHQMDLYKTFTEAGYAMGAIDKPGLRNCILEADNFFPVEFRSNQQNFVSIIKNLMEN